MRPDETLTLDERLRLVPFDRLIAICAFRYALGRMTYMVEHVSSWLMANRDRLSAHDRALIVREIDEAAERGGLGMPVDQARWTRVQSAMTEQGA